MKRKWLRNAIWMSLWLTLPQVSPGDNDYRARREQMVKTQIDWRGVRDGRIGVKDEKVLEAMRQTPRHEFVPDDLRGVAYTDAPLPIGYDQTISQPYIVGYMTEQLRLEKGDKVLEVGTGSGYQAAVLAELEADVYTIELIKELGERAEKTLKRLGYESVKTKIADGYYGWEEHAPFDAIIVTAASDHVPPPLIKQLKPGGVMCIPVGGRFQVQNLTLVEKKEDGSVKTKQLMPVRFVPLTGKR
jgi:protein-L-isoaspartate(D-aspartate) O-methyltransferase